MISLQIQDIKRFMNQLLLTNAFDHFYLFDGSITTFHTFQIQGQLHKDFFTAQEQELMDLDHRSYAYWKEVKPICLELIKGKKTPLEFKFTFCLSKENTQKLLLSSSITQILPEQIQGLYFHVKFREKELTCITGSSLNFFSLDKTLDQAWDQMIQKFLKQQEISFL